GAGFDAALFTAIAQAQEWLGAAGRLSRIDVRVAGGAPGAALAWLRAQLPADLELHATRAQARETFAMTDAFTTNLKAMSLLALLVGTFLIYGAVSFAVLQRRATIAVLRALGATRGEVLAVVLGEAALLPALEVAASAPQLGLARSVLETRAVRVARTLAVVSALLAVGAGLIAWVSGRSLLAGFATLFMLLLSVAAVTPAALRVLAQAAARLGARLSPVARLACGDIAASLSRARAASAARGMA